MSDSILPRLQRKLSREQRARNEAERMLEDISRKLYDRNSELTELSESLEKQVIERTQELIDARDSALAAAKAKSDFVANMSHELRTPLNGVLGMLDILGKTPLNEEQADFLRVAKQAGNHLLTTINDILDFSKLEANKQELDYTDIDLRTDLQRIMEPYVHSAKQRNNELILQVDGSVPELVVSDITCIRQLLTNLVGNAIKFTQNGTITVRVFVASSELHIVVNDTGIGMTASQVERVFEAFEQADTSTVRKFGGTGLGLSICKEVVSLLSGSLSVSSARGTGSKFEVTLPLMHSLAMSNKLKSAKSATHTPLESEQIEFCKQRVLLAEDNDVNVKVAVFLLNDANLHVDVANNGQIAVEMASSTKYDLILMDLQMPVMGGIEAAERIRRRGQDADALPIIALTANTQSQDKQACAKAGMQGHISKPIDTESLYKELSRFLKTQSRTANTHQDGCAEMPLPESTDMLNIESALTRLNGNTALLASLYNTFIEQNESLVQTVRQQLETQEHAQLVSLLHTLKGSSANLGAMTLSKVAGTMESRGKEDQWHIVSKFMPDFSTTLDETLNAMRDTLTNIEGNTESAASFSLVEWQRQFSEYLQIVDEDIVTADELVQEWRTHSLPVDYSKEIKAFFDAHDAFETDQAKQCLTELSTRLSAVNE